MSQDIESTYKGRLMVVDDEEIIAEMLEKFLCANGYYVRTATDFEAVDQLLTQESFDLVTLDVAIPNTSGMDILRWIKTHYPDLGVVMASGIEDIETVTEAMRLGAYDYLTKPFNMDLVLSEIDQAMARQRLVKENRAYQQRLEEMVAARTQELQDAYALLERKVQELEGLEHLMRCQMGYHTPDEAVTEILQVFERVLPVDQVVLYTPASDHTLLQARGALGIAEAGRIEGGAELANIEPIPVGDASSITSRAFSTQQPCQDLYQEAATPLLHSDHVQGVLWVRWTHSVEEEGIYNILWRLGQEAASLLWSVQVAESVEQGRVKVRDLLNLA